MAGHHLTLVSIQQFQLSESLFPLDLGLGLGISTMSVSIAALPQIQPPFQYGLGNLDGPCLSILLPVKSTQVLLLAFPQLVIGVQFHQVLGQAFIELLPAFQSAGSTAFIEVVPGFH